MTEEYNRNNEDFPKAVPVERGCGFRERGAAYIEMGLSRHGLPFDWFLLCPPQEPPQGLDLINKPQLWSPNPEDEHPLYHVLIWIGQEHYENAVDFIEEARRFGISRRIRSNFDFDKLTPGRSRMVLIHPKALNTHWDQQTPPGYCPRERTAHLEPLQETEFDPDYYRVTVTNPEEKDKLSPNLELALPPVNRPVEGPCLGKLYELLPVPKEQKPGELAFRRMPGFTYTYTPTGESAGGCTTGIFGIFPITGIALIKREDGSVNEKARVKIMEAGLNYYHADA